MSLSATVGTYSMSIGFDEVNGGFEVWESLGKWLLERGRVIVFLNWDKTTAWTGRDLLQVVEAGGRLIIATTGQIPPELYEVAVTNALPADDIANRLE